MTAPNKFIINTDYLSIAQSGKYSHTYIRNSGTVPAYGQIVEHQDFTVPSQKGAIDQVMISLNGSSLKVGTRFGFDLENNGSGYLAVYRTNPNTLRAELWINNLFNPSAVNFPLLNFIIKGLTFLPPNLF